MTTIYTDKKDLPERKLNDVYPTEKDLVVQALSHVNLISVCMILDIGAGDGRWGRTAKMLTRGEANLCGVDIVGDCPKGFDRWDQNDYLAQHYENKTFDLIVSNPPYYIAEKIIRKAWVELAPGGEMIFLLRLSFQAGVDRANSLWQEIYPYKIGIVSRRPSFYDRGTNGTDYGVYYWKKDLKGNCFGVPGEWQTFLLLHKRDPLRGDSSLLAKSLGVTDTPKVTQLPLPLNNVNISREEYLAMIEDERSKGCREYIEGIWEQDGPKK